MATTVVIRPSADGAVLDDHVDATIRRRVDGCPYKYIFVRVTWDYHDGKLTLRGCVPSFHLKQQLQELLRGIEYVTLITNSVDVVSSTGLSSERFDTIGFAPTL
jgi:hypothetical protein